MSSCISEKNVRAFMLSHNAYYKQSDEGWSRSVGFYKNTGIINRLYSNFLGCQYCFLDIKNTSLVLCKIMNFLLLPSVNVFSPISGYMCTLLLLFFFFFFLLTPAFSPFFLFVLFFLEIVSCHTGQPQTFCVARGDPELLILLFHLSKCWDQEHKPPHIWFYKIPRIKLMHARQAPQELSHILSLLSIVRYFVFPCYILKAVDIYEFVFNSNTSFKQKYWE